MIKLKLSHEPFDRSRHDQNSLVFYKADYSDLEKEELTIYDSYKEYRKIYDSERLSKKHSPVILEDPMLINRKFLYKPCLAYIDSENNIQTKSDCFFMSERDAKNYLKLNSSSIMKPYNYVKKVKIKIFDKKEDYDSELKKKKQYASKFSKEQKQLLGINDNGIKL